MMEERISSFFFKLRFLFQHIHYFVLHFLGSFQFPESGLGLNVYFLIQPDLTVNVITNIVLHTAHEKCVLNETTSTPGLFIYL